MYKCLYETLLLIILGNFAFTFGETSTPCPMGGLHRFTLPTAVHQGCSLSISFPTLVIFCFFLDKGHPDGCEVVPRCGLDLCFSSD